MRSIPLNDRSPYVDTDAIIRLLPGDDPEKQAAAAALFARVAAGDLELQAPDTVIADAVYVLGLPRLYNVARPDIQAMLSTLLRLPGFQVDNREVLLRALDVYASAPIDFGDAVIVASMDLARSTLLYSYDADFDRFRHIERQGP